MTPEQEAFVEKLRSLHFGGTKAASKKTVDVHDNHTVTTTESAGDRVDVAVQQLEPVRINPARVGGYPQE